MAANLIATNAKFNKGGASKNGYGYFVGIGTIVTTAISNDTEYYNVFAIEGYTSQFYELWGHAFGSYGSLSSSYERLTENNIIQVGTYGEKISVVYDISIKKPGSDKYYTKSVMSTLGVPVSQKLNKKDAVTGEPVE